jgi:orotidine-5'-phosphate decarboxylase
MKFIDKLLAASRQNNSLLCVGLDPEPVRFPPQYLGKPADEAVLHFCCEIIEATAPYVCAFKPNIAFFEVLGMHGMATFQRVLEAIPAHIPVIVDAKRGDIGNTARNYASAFFDTYGCDALTVNPYLGRDSVEPFLAHRDKGVFVLCRTSNAGARDFQNLLVQDADGTVRPVYEVVAQQVGQWGDNCGLVVGATYPGELSRIREICPELPILVPGVGAQGGDLVASVAAGVDARGERAIIAVSRAILYAGDGNEYVRAAAKEAEALRDQINRARSGRF